MTRFAPFMQHLRHLCCGDRSSVQGSDHDVVGTLIVDPCLVVAEDPLIEAAEFAFWGRFANSFRRNKRPYPKVGLTRAEYFRRF